MGIVVNIVGLSVMTSRIIVNTIYREFRHGEYSALCQLQNVIQFKVNQPFALVQLGSNQRKGFPPASTIIHGNGVSAQVTCGSLLLFAADFKKYGTIFNIEFAKDIYNHLIVNRRTRIY